MKTKLLSPIRQCNFFVAIRFANLRSFSSDTLTNTKCIKSKKVFCYSFPVFVLMPNYQWSTKNNDFYNMIYRFKCLQFTYMHVVTIYTCMNIHQNICVYVLLSTFDFNYKQHYSTFAEASKFGVSTI